MPVPINLILQCDDLDLTKRYYRETLRFDVSDTAMGTCTARLEDCSIIFFTSNDPENPPQCTGTFYLFVTDVDEYFATVRNAVELAWPLQDMSYGTREFAVNELNGYRLAFAQSSP